MLRILWTGFDAFGKKALNSSQLLTQALAGISLPGIQSEFALLPTSFSRCVGALMAAVDKFQPEAVICFGEAAGRSAINVEQVAINHIYSQAADNDDVILKHEPILPGGREAYFSTIPVVNMVERCCRAGIPCQVSFSAGTFVCNYLAYLMLHTFHEQARQIKAGLIHIPLVPEQAVDKMNCPAMATSTVMEGIQALLPALTES